MLSALDPPALAELKNVLEHRLASEPEPEAERLHVLAFLAELVRQAPTRGGASPRVPRTSYDETRPTDAPTSKRLVEWHGSWLNACRAASAMLADGRSTGTANPWRNGRLGRAYYVYTREDLLQAIRMCARDTGRIPSANLYKQWADTRRRRLRAAGAAGGDPRVPAVNTIYNHFKRWRDVIVAAGLDAVELRRNRARALGGTRAGAAPIASTDALTLSAAARHAREFNGSLEWLAGRTHERGTPPPPGDIELNTEVLRGALKRRGVTETLMRHQLGIALGPYRRLLTARDEPTLGQLAALAAATSTTIDKLCRTRG